MKIFISWSGTYSHGVAMALKNWLPFIFTDIQTFVSSESVRKGQRWLPEISKHLATTNFGIICLTVDNLMAPWILFEAGALSKLQSSQVCSLLLGNLRPSDIEGPLSQFQNTPFNKDEFFKLMQSINSKTGKNSLDAQRLTIMFEKWWPELQKSIDSVSKHSQLQQQEKRSTEQKIDDILDTVRSIARNMPNEQAELKKLRKLLEMSVDEIELSNEANSVLKKANIKNIGTLSMNDGREILRLGGKRILNEISDKLAALGLTLGMTYDPTLFPDFA